MSALSACRVDTFLRAPAYAAGPAEGGAKSAHSATSKPSLYLRFLSEDREKARVEGLLQLRTCGGPGAVAARAEGPPNFASAIDRYSVLRSTE